MTRYRALITLPYVQPGNPIEAFLREADIDPILSPWHGGQTEEELIGLLRDVDGVIAYTDRFTEHVMMVSPKLKVISRSGVGYDDVDAAAATRLGVAVCTTPGRNHNAVAEYTCALMLQCYRKLYENLQVGRQGGWRLHQGRDLVGRTLGIVGMGAIGKQVARRARAFEMQVLGYDVREDPDFAAQYGVTYISLENLLRQSDLVSLHLFLDAHSRHLMNAERLALMKPTAYLINTSRGAVVDSAALYRALNRKQIAGAALDVFEEEPLPADSPLRTLENVYISPHCAGATDDARNAQVVMAAENMLRVFRGETPLHIVNPDVWGKRRQ